MFYGKDGNVTSFSEPEGYGAVDGVTRTVRQLEAVSKLAPDTAGGLRPVSDSAQAINPHQTDLGVTSKLEYGMIVDVVPGARCYKILPEDGGTPLACAFATRGSITPIGTYDADTLTVGTQVRFVRHPGTHSGLIMCTEPMYSWDPRRFYGDIISMGSNTGLHVESAFQQPFALGGTQDIMELNGGVSDYSGRSSIDSLEIGEFNKVTETGLMMHLDPYMGFMRVDEMCGMWMFYWDSMLRIAGQNFEEWAAHSQREAYDDEGESVYYHGISSFPWEGMGQLTAPNDVWTEATADVIQNTAPYYARVEPTNDTLQPFHRFREYSGYLGQGQKKLMCAPLYAGTPDTNYTYEDTTYSALGLHEQNITMGGHWGVRSALGMTIAKRPIIPVPKRNNLVQSEYGDKSSNYFASSYFGDNTKPHEVQPTPSAEGTVTDNETTWHMAACVIDLHAHLFNWQASHPFHYHTDDYYLEEEASYTNVTANQSAPTYTDLRSIPTPTQWFLDLPPVTSNVRIDHRSYMTADIYHSTSYLTFLDEGGIVLGDGWGSEIRMGGGCINLECAGDVFCNAGRNVINWGGRDVITRASHSVDITANLRDVKIKAEDNIQILAGNGPNGAPYGGHVLIESRAPAGSTGGSHDWSNTGTNIDANGIILRAINTEIVGWGKSIYMRSGDLPTGKATAGTPNAATPKEGDIVFDTYGESTGTGGDFITRSNFVKHWVHCAVAHVFEDKPSAENVNFFTVDGATLCGDVYTDGDLISYGSHVAGDDFLSCNGHFYSPIGGTTKKLTSAAATSVCATRTAGRNYETALKSWADTAYGVDMTNMWYANGRPGGDYVIESAWASLRDEAEYGTQEWFMFEPRWAQINRVFGGDTAPKWTEKAVETNVTGSPGESYPFPGRERLTVDSSYYEQNFTLNDVVGWANSRSSGDYDADVTLAAPTKSIPNGNFPHLY